MKKLFVIGNGFDSAHKLPTTYDDFRQYLCNTYRNRRTGNDFMPIISSVSMDPKGGICNMSEVAEFLVSIISMAEPDGDKWSELEASLGRLDYDVVFDILLKESCHPDYTRNVVFAIC